MPSDPLLTFVAEALAEEAHIQGFTYAGHCAIRGVAKRWAGQEIWREPGIDYAAQARMARRIEVKRLKRAFDAALRRIGSPFPGTDTVAAARAAPHLPEGRLSE